MKARNKYEQRLEQLSLTLPDIHNYTEFGIQNTFKPQIAISRNKLFCLECNHKWDDGLQKWQYEKLGNITCPSCLKKGEVLKYNDVHFKDWTYTMILDRVGEFQVIRYMYIERYAHKTEKPRYSTNEVIQRWINPQGRSTIFTKSLGGMMGNYNGGWQLGTKLSIKYDHQKYTVYHPNAIYPKRKIIPTLKRNGFKTSFHGCAADELFVALLKYPKGETLIKAKQFQLLKAGINRFNLDKYWSSIKIAIRNNYFISDPSSWRDYLNLLSYFQKDLRNPTVVCPENFKKAHNTLVARKKRIDDRQKAIDDRERAIRTAQAQAEKDKKDKQLLRNYKSRIKKYAPLIFTEGNITITVVKTINEFQTIGEVLKHCVFTNRYWNREESLILSAKLNDELLETIEVDLETMEIIQARGFDNEPSKHNKKVVQLITKNIHKIKKIKYQSMKQKTAA
jgi:hypothetical protein